MKNWTGREEEVIRKQTFPPYKEKEERERKRERKERKSVVFLPRLEKKEGEEQLI